MITTTEVQPSPELAPFIRCYSLRHFNTNGFDLVKSWNALHEISMCFFFNANPVHLMEPQTNRIVKNGHNAGLMGLSTQYNGEMTFNGNYSMFEIIFKPNGFYKLFKIPPNKILNKIIDAEDIFNSKVNAFFEQLYCCKQLPEMTMLANTFFLPLLKKQKSFDTNDRITSISNLILKNAGIINIDKLAYDANMTLRSFERHFNEHVGIPPKLYSCITRFNHALNLKFQHPQTAWTSIAYKSGYFDQMHLIKDFKRFTGNTPSSFLKQTPLKDESFTSRVEA